MCTNHFKKYNCGHFEFLRDEPCRRRRQKARGCTGWLKSWIPCTRHQRIIRSLRLCDECRKSQEAQSSGRVDEHIEMESQHVQGITDRGNSETGRVDEHTEMQNQHVLATTDCGNSETTRQPEKSPNRTSRFKEHLGETNEDAEPYRAEWLDAQGVRPSTATRQQEHSGHHAGKSQDHRQIQKKAGLEREMRSNRKPVPTSAQVAASEATVVESQGINWDARQPEVSTWSVPARKSSLRNQQGDFQTGGFSHEAYNSYWAGRQPQREEIPRAVSPLNAADLDFERYPNVEIPEYDEYPNHHV